MAFTVKNEVGKEDSVETSKTNGEGVGASFVDPTANILSDIPFRYLHDDKPNRPMD
jgi:hypothetical protein